MVDQVLPSVKFCEIIEGDGKFNSAFMLQWDFETLYLCAKLTNIGSFHGENLLDKEFEDCIKDYVGLRKRKQLATFRRRIPYETWE